MTLVPRQTHRMFPMFLLVLAATTSSYAADNYLKVIPASALSLGAVNHMSEASDKIQKLAAAVQAPPVSVLDEAKKEFGVTKGLDEKGAAGFFVVPGKTEKDPSVTAIFVAVADEKEFLANFEVVKSGEAISEIKPKSDEDKPAIGGMGPPRGPRSTATSCLAFRGGFALLAPKSDRAALEAAVNANQTIAAEMTGMESWLAENDGVLVGTAAGIKVGAKKAEIDFKDPNRAGGSTAEMAAFSKSFESFFCKSCMAAPNEVSLVTTGIRCDMQGSIRVIGRARLVSGGLVSKAVAGIPPVSEKLLSGVPGGPFVFAAAGVGIPNLMDGYASMAAAFMKGMKSLYGMSDEDIERMSKESMAAFRQVRSMSFVMKTGKRGDPIYSNIYAAMHVENSGKLLDLQEKYAENANKLMQNAKQGVLKSMTAHRLEIAGQPALEQEMNFDFSGMPGAEASRAALDAMMGLGGKMLLYHVAADEHTVLMGIGVSQERMAAGLDVLKQPKRSLAEDADVAVTAAMLPPDSQWVAYLSLRGYMQLTQRLMSAALKNAPGAEDFTLPQFGKAPPVGLAVTATPAELRAEIAVPAAVVQATGDYVKEMQQMIMNRMMQQAQPAARRREKWTTNNLHISPRVACLKPSRLGMFAADTQIRKSFVISTPKLSWLSDELAALDRGGLRRRLSSRASGQSATIVLDGQELVNFGSNDYLALAADHRLAAAAIANIESAGIGSGASPLITGHCDTHRQLEDRLAEFEGTPAALLFPTGFAANLAAVTALAGPGDVVFSDAKNHASLWDGCRLSRADVRAYPHADWQQLDTLLARASGYRRRLVVTDSLFSMDGDLAPLVEIAEVVPRHEAMLLVDEAHATGVFGRGGRGVCEHLGVEEGVTARVGTLSKALGCAGGFIVGSRPMIDWLINRARSYIYSTAAPAAISAAALAALEIVIAEPHRRRKLLERAAALRQRLSEQGWPPGPSASQIIPIMVGEPGRAVELSQTLRRRGLFVPAIRPPTVPEGEACLRVSLNWGHTDEQIAALVEGLAAVH